MGKILVIFLVTLCNSAYILSIPIENCKDITEVINFESEGCVKTPCPLVRGTTSNANVTFRIPHDMEKGIIDIKAKAFGLWVPFPPPDSNICHSLVNSYCPLEEDEYVTYNLGIPIQKLYPTISLVLKLTFKDETGKAIACMQVPCQVVDA